MLARFLMCCVTGACSLVAVMATPALADVAAQSQAGHLHPKRIKLPKKVLKRIVFLGDSITDGNTYPMFVRDALLAAGVPKVTAINAGIGGDTAAMMLARLDRDVLAQHPTLVTLFASANDVGRVSAQDYEKTVRIIIERLRAAHIPLILLTPESLEAKAPARIVEGFAQYDAVLRRLAVEYRLRIAEVGARMHEDGAAGHLQHAPDGHPNYTGQRSIARAVLDAMGYADVPVAARAHAVLQPGVIPVWKLRPVGAQEAKLDVRTVATLLPDDRWVTVTLPESEPITGDENIWLDDCRLQGAAIWLKKVVGGETGKYLGIATIDTRNARTVNFHTGAGLSTVWLNGQVIYENQWKHGWHLGRESVAAQLQPGKNTIVIETGDVFFLSITKDGYWK